ncbi:MAG: nitroreductase family protein [Anaerolineae bacterium]|nr:nitroreductase family protein [Anaerolineae bacterium]
MIETTCSIRKEGRFSLIYLNVNIRKITTLDKGTLYALCELNGIQFRAKIMSKGNDIFFIQTNKELRTKLQIDNIMGKDLPIKIEIDSGNGTQTSSTTNYAFINNRFLEIIYTRRSIRKYLNKEIPQEIINTIIKAGCYAPSAKNKKPYSFVVIRDKTVLKKIAINGRNTKMVEYANVCIVVCGDKAVQGIKELLIEDCAAVTENILLAAHALGLGAVWCGVVFNSDLYHLLIRELELVDKIIPISVISLGYPNEERNISEQFDPGKVHNEVW